MGPEFSRRKGRKEGGPGGEGRGRRAGKECVFTRASWDALLTAKTGAARARTEMRAANMLAAVRVERVEREREGGV